MTEKHGTHSLPDGFHLLPGEKLVVAEKFDARPLKKHLSGLEQMLRLTSAESPEMIGQTGPALAAIAIKASDLAVPQEAPQHLRLMKQYSAEIHCARPSTLFLCTQNFRAHRYCAWQNYKA